MSGSGEIVMQCRGLTRSFRRRTLTGRSAGEFTAVEGVDLDIAAGETLALVGESGCGKTTTGRLLLRLEQPSAGRIVFRGQDITGLGERALRPLRRHMQMVFQDPYGSLNPRFRVGAAIGEPLKIHRGLRGGHLRERVAGLLETVGLSASHSSRFPHEFSGGQRQRIAIARAVSVAPGFVVADEPVSALDISVQGQILKLLLELKQRYEMAMLFISHDLAVVRQVSERVAVMYGGRIVELAPTAAVLDTPLHPYTRLLLDSVLDTAPPGPEDYRRESEAERSGKPAALEAGCVFAPRCRFAGGRCSGSAAGLREIGPGHFVACELAEENKR